MKTFRYCFCQIVGLFFSSVTSTSLNAVEVQGHDVELCPNWHFCSVWDRDPKCKCESRFERVGDCCIDYLQERNRSLNTPLEMPVLCINTTKLESFYLVNACNDTWDDESIASLCEAKADSSDILLNLPVSDPTTNIDYKNFYCSTCNYVEKQDVVPWEITLICNQTLTNITTLKNIGKECLVEYRSRASFPVKCDESIIRTCTDSYPVNSDEARKCRTYSAEVNIDGSIYKNPHCAACNNIDVQNINCSLIVEGESGSSGNPFPVDTKSLKIIFDFHDSNARAQSRDYAVPEIQGSCENDAIYDPFEERCLIVSCAKGLQYIDGECRPLLIERSFHTCESSSLNIDYITSENQTSCLTEVLNINKNVTSRLTQCNDRTCFNNSLQIFEVNSSLPEHLRSLFETVFLNKEGQVCSISSIQVTHVCHNIPHDTCFNLSDYQDVNNSQTYYEVYNLKWHYSFQYNTVIQIYNLTSDDRVCNADKQINLKCPFVIKPASEFYVHCDKSDKIVHNDTGIIYGSTEYEYLRNGSISVCFKHGKTNDGLNNNDDNYIQESITQICILCSLVALLITFIFYCRFRALRTLPGKSVMNLVVALFFALLIFLFGSGQTQYQNVCTAVAILQHFFLLAAFFWMNVLAFDVRRTFSYKGSPQNAHRNLKTLVLYAVYAWGSPAIIVGICLALIYSQIELNLYYGNSDACIIGNATMNLIAFGGPVALTLSLNIVFFIMTVVSIRKTKQATKVVQNKSKSKSRFQELLIYAKLSTLMGITWVTGFISTITNLDAVWYVYIVLNSLQGVFVFLFFVCNSRVYKLIKGKTPGTSSKTKSTDVKSDGRETSKARTSQT